MVGIRDVALSERLQTDENLALDKAKKMIRQGDAVREQQTRREPITELRGEKWPAN